uniref:Ionotropic glutamate receptor C-terminal domain-containing protein n=1 Tax=Anopheles dirus TaxID=7168 RepID=A0A182N506_9DIPT
MGFSLLMLQFYSSFIVGYQLITPPKTITTLDKLVDSNLKMSVENLSYHRDFFDRTKNPAALKLYRTKILPNKYAFVNLSFGVHLLKQGGYAFHCETSYGNTLIIEMLTEREICELQQIQLYPQRPVHLPLIKGSPLRELFKINLQLMKESGLIAYHHARNYIPTPKCNKKSSNHAEPIYLADVKFAFQLLAVGMAAGVVVLAWEVGLERAKQWWRLHHKPLTVPEDFDFIEHTKITSVTVVHCLQEQPDRDVLLLARKLHNHFRGTVTYIDIGGSHRAYLTQIPVSSVDLRSQHRLGFIMNLECSASRPFLLHASQQNSFNSSYRWLFFGGQNSTQSKSLLAELNINIDARITLATTYGKNSTSYVVYDVFGSIKRRGGVLKFDYLGNSTPHSGWHGASKKRDDLHQIELWAVVSTLNEHQPQSLEKYLSFTAPKPRAYNAPQFAYHIIKLLKYRLNFSNANASVGLVGQLVTKQVDFSAVPLSMQTERLPLFDPTIEILRGKFYTLFRHPKKAFGRNIFLQPFQGMVWVGLVILLGLISALLSATFVVQGANITEMPLSLVITLGTLAQQAAVTGWMRHASGKVLLLAAFGCCMLLLQFYSSFIIGYQLVEQPRTINTMQQLIASGMPIAIENLSYNRDFFMVLRSNGRTNDPIALQLYEKHVLPNKDGFLNVSDGIALIKQGGHAFHCDTTYGYTHILGRAQVQVSETFTESQICDLHRVTLYPHRVIHLPVTKGSPLKELFKVHLQIIRESGILAYQQARYRAANPRCIRDSHHTEPIALDDVVSAFLLLAVGVLISTLILLVEVLFQLVKLVFYTVLLLSVVPTGQCSARLELIKAFLEQHSITSLILLHCIEEPVDQDVIRISKPLHSYFLGTIYHIDVNKAHFRQQFQWHMYYERYKSAIVLNLECSRIETVMEHLSENAYFNSTFHWLMFGGRNFSEVTCLLSNQNINYDSSITLVFERDDPNDERFEVYDVSGTVKRREGRVRFTLLGITSSLNRLPKPAARRQDLDGILLRAVVTTANLHQPRPFLEHLNSVAKPRSYRATTNSYQLVKLLQMRLNFKMTMTLASDWSFDLIGKNTSRALVGQIQTKEVDFSVTPIAVTAERIPIMDFTIEIAHGTFYTVFRHPKSLNEANIFLLPFNKLLWIAISAMFCGVAFFLGLSIVCTRRRNQEGSYVDLLGEQVFLGTVGILGQQGFHDHPSGRGTNRLLLFVGMGFSLLMLQFYSSFIVGYQLITPPKTITTLERLVDSNLKMSVENLSYQHDFFLRTKNPAALKLYETKILPNKYGFVNVTFGIQLVKKGGYAFHCETSYGNTLIIGQLLDTVLNASINV